MSEYSAVRVGKLRLKGAAGAGLKAKKKRKRRRESQEGLRQEDLRHGIYYVTRRRPCIILYTGGWRRVCSRETLGGRILILTCTGGYIEALDSGGFVVGEPREEGIGVP